MCPIHNVILDNIFYRLHNTHIFVLSKDGPPVKEENCRGQVNRSWTVVMITVSTVVNEKGP